MLNILRPGHGERVSKGWLWRFCLRYGIASKMKTDKKTFNVEERWGEIAKFHQDILYTQRSMPQVCPEWGAYPPLFIWNADHVPAPFAINCKRSLNMKGQACWIVSAGPSGLDKRQCTLHICARAIGPQIMPIWVIFRGKAGISDEEREYLDSFPNLRWAFQENAWADGVYSKKWIRSFCSTVQSHQPGNHLLFLDDLSAQKLTQFREISCSNGVLPFPIPPNCTDVCQPVDVGLGKAVKSIMSELYKKELEISFDEWRNYRNNGSLAASRRRMLIARWASYAWEKVSQDSDLISRCFEKTVLIRRDGTHRLEAQGHGRIGPITLD